VGRDIRFLVVSRSGSELECWSHRWGLEGSVVEDQAGVGARWKPYSSCLKARDGRASREAVGGRHLQAAGDGSQQTVTDCSRRLPDRQWFVESTLPHKSQR